MNDAPQPNHKAGRNATYGLWFFALYCLFYAGFMYLATFHFNLLRHDALAGINWAVLYGMGLILAAIVLAIIYVIVCNPAHDHAETIHEGEDHQ